MLPELFRIGDFPIRSFGILLLIGVLVAAWMARQRAPRYGIDPAKIWDLAIWAFLPGILGARVVFILQEWPYYSQHPEEIWTIQFQGLTSFGGLLFGFIGALIWAKVNRIDLRAMLDVAGVPVLVAQAIGRVGCLLNGCCYGRVSDSPVAVHFSGAPERHIPAQMIDSVLLVACALAVIVWERRGLSPGRSFALATAGFGFSRFVYEFWRAGTPDEVRPGIASSSYMGNLPITDSQVVALVMVAIGAFLYWWYGRRPAAANAGAAG